jgi:hypothetical protein
MSRAFVDNGQGYDASPRVYVNNMNTPHPTDNLPERRPTPRSLMRGNGSLVGNSNGAHTLYAGSNLNTSHGPSSSAAGMQAHAYAGGGSGKGGGRSAFTRNTTPTTARGDELHPNLHDVYSRIMRRLQRQMNYAELSRAPLAEQYGVDLELQCEVEAAALEQQQHDDGGEHDGGRGGNSNVHNHSCAAVGGGGDAMMMMTDSLPQTSRAPVNNELDALDEDSRPTSHNHSSVLHPRLPGSSSNNNSVNAHGAPGNAEPSRAQGSQEATTRSGAGGGASRLLQFKQQQLPTIRAAGADSFDDGAVTDGKSAAGTRSDVDVEREMAEQPCPRPLRLVVQHVLDTLQKKMSLAESGSLRDCIAFSFECRALLDRLLKEIPLYTQYTNTFTSATAGSGGSSSGAVQQAVSEIYQQLRKRPVLLPRGAYVEEAATGAIRAELIASENGNDDLGAGVSLSSAATTRLPNIHVLPLTGANAVEAHEGQSTGYTALPELSLPAGYGKSARLAAAGSSQLSQKSGQRSFRHPILRDHLSAADGWSTFAAESFGDVSELTTSGYAEAQAGINGGGAGRSVYVTPDAAAAHRATQLVSVGTITDDNGVTTVPRADYAALQQRVEELQNQLAEAKHHRSALADQLCEEAQYTDQKKRIIQYLRETLVRECNMLRTQLHHAASPSSLAPTTGKGPYAQRGGGNGGALGSTGLFKESSVALAGSGTSMHNSHARQQLKQSTGATLSSSTTMGVSVLLQQQQKASVDHPSENSGSLGSVYGDNSSVTANGGGAKRSTAGRPSPQSHHTGNNNASIIIGGNRGSPGPSTSVAGSGGNGHYSRADAATFQAEVDAVHSLLDLALLAVEEESVLPSHTAQLLKSGHGDKDVLRSGFRKNAKQQLDELRVDFEGRQQALKRTLLQQTAEHNYVVAEQQSEVNRLRALTDTSRVRDTLQKSVAEIRAQLNRVRMQVAEQLHFFKAILHSTGQGLLHRAALVDSTMSDNVALSSTLGAMEELIESANSLFLPMLTHEYECGYHPWPLKVRNTRDPLSRVVQLRFGTAEVVQLRGPLTEFGKLYVAIHQYVMDHAVLPESARPTTGKPLEDLCAALALNPISNTEVVFAARRCHDMEGQLRKKLARLQSRILWNAYLQRTYTERSVAALAEAGIDPRVATLPVARRLDALAQQRGDLLHARVKLQRERSDNAKELYRLWSEREIDIMEGYPTPQTQRNRLALLSSTGAAGAGEDGGAVVNANTRSARRPLLLKRQSTDRSAMAAMMGM